MQNLISLEETLVSLEEALLDVYDIFLIFYIGLPVPNLMTIFISNLFCQFFPKKLSFHGCIFFLQ